MAKTQTREEKRLRVYPPPPADFDPFTATSKDLMRHGLPLRPDARSQPGMAVLWERRAARYRQFQHLEPKFNTATAPGKAISAIAPAFGPDPTDSCGYQLFVASATIGALSVTWTLPDLQYTPSALNVDYFHTFVGLGFLDLHVEMTVDAEQNVTAQLQSPGIAVPINLPVRPGDVLSCVMCLENNDRGTAAFFLANETTSQTMNFAVDTGFPPAVTVNAGVTRTWSLNQPFPPLARFGAVYFDEISVFTTGGPRSLTSGQSITMVGQNGRVLAEPVQLNDSAFKTVFVAA